MKLTRVYDFLRNLVNMVQLGRVRPAFYDDENQPIFTRENWVKRYANLVYAIARSHQKNDGRIFPEVALAQSIIESSAPKDGTYYPAYSELSQLANNVYGIKSSSTWTGETINMRTREVFDGKEVYVDDDFRKYKSRTSSFVDYFKFLKSNNRYSDVYKAQTIEQQIIELKKAGYATDPTYVSMMLNVALGIRKWMPVKTQTAEYKTTNAKHSKWMQDNTGGDGDGNANTGNSSGGGMLLTGIVLFLGYRAYKRQG